MTLEKRLLGKELNKQICFLSSFAMILVVIGHSDITDDYKELFIYRWVYGFHMPLFFFVSGFLFAYTTPKEKLERLDLGRFFLKKMKRLLIPFLIFNTLFFIVKATLISPEQMQHPVELTLNSFVHYSLVNPIGYLWFLPTLFVIFVVFIPLIKYLAKMKGFILSLIILGIGGGVFSLYLPHVFEVDRAFWFSPFFIAGFIYCIEKILADIFIKKFLDLILPATLLISIILLNKGSFMSGYVGIIFAVSLSLALVSRVANYTVVFSRLTYTIFLLSYIPQMFIRGPVGPLDTCQPIYTFMLVVCLWTNLSCCDRTLCAVAERLKILENY